MRVQIDDIEAFESGELASYEQLQRLFIRAALGQYELDLSDPERVLNSDFMRVAVPDLNRAAWEELVRRTAAAPAFASTSIPKNYAIVTGDSSNQDDPATFVIKLQEVGEWAERPLRVFLENARDAILIRLAMGETNSAQLQQAFAYGWLIPEGRGGSGEVYNAILSSKPRCDRFFTVIDSDRDEASVEDGKTARLIRKALVERANGNGAKDNVPLHVLKQRELENYVPGVIWELLVATLRPRRTKSQSRGVEHRTVLVYRWVLRLIEAQGDSATKHGKDALGKVVTALSRKAVQKVPARFINELLKEWQDLPPEGKSVDDLKVRFGESMAAHAVEKLGADDFDPNWLDADARAEFRELADKLEEWL